MKSEMDHSRNSIATIQTSKMWPHRYANVFLSADRLSLAFGPIKQQILRVSELDVIATGIRTGIDLLAEAQGILKAQVEAAKRDSNSETLGRFRTSGNQPQLDDSDEAFNPVTSGLQNFVFGAPLPDVSFEDLEKIVGTDIPSQAYSHIRTKFNKYLAKALGRARVVLPVTHVVRQFIFVLNFCIQLFGSYLGPGGAISLHQSSICLCC